MTRVLSIGQCGVDHAGISRFLASRFDAETTDVDDAEEADAALREGSFDLILVNRVLDRDGGDGLDIVRRLVADASVDAPVMLVTNFSDWQARAVAVGAVPGFGKAELGDRPGEVAERLAPLLGREDSSTGGTT